MFTVSERIFFVSSKSHLNTARDRNPQAWPCDARSWMSSSHVTTSPSNETHGSLFFWPQILYVFFHFSLRLQLGQQRTLSQNKKTVLPVAQKSVFFPRCCVGFQTSLISNVFITQTSLFISKQSCSVLGSRKSLHSQLHY